MNQKNIIIIVLVIIILFSAGLSTYNFSLLTATTSPQPTGGIDADTIEGGLVPTETAAKNISYENKKYGFSLMYPATLTAVSGNGAIVSFKSGEAAEIRVLKITDSPTDFQNTLIQDTFYDGSGANPKSFSEFTEKTIGQNDFYFIKSGLFEGVLTLHYYLVRKDGIYDFSLVSRGVDWTNPSFNLDEEQGYVYLKQMLGTLSFAGSPSPVATSMPTSMPAKPATSLIYRNDEAGYTVQYPKGFFAVESGRNPLNMNETFSGIFFNFPSSFVLGTNLSKESFISVETKVEIACTPKDFLMAGNPGSTSTIQADGLTFKGQSASDAAAGNRYNETVYTTLHKNVCYGIRLFLHSGNIDNYDPGTVRAFDQAKIESLFKEMVSSFRFI